MQMAGTLSVSSIFADLPIPPGIILPETVEEAGSGMLKVTFPGGFWCYTRDAPVEAVLIYNEIMVSEEYFRHGLSVADARCVLDVGGNIGIFTLATKLRAPGATVYTFEPMPDTFEALLLNVRSHGCQDVHLYNLAVGAQDHARQTFTFYPHMPGNATQAPAMKDDQRPAMDQIFGKEITDFLYESQTREAEVRTLSSLIHEHGITRVDYLKIDVEGAELAVLDGIAETDWPVIRQVAVETHTDQLRQQVADCLTVHGFEVEPDRGLASAVGVSDVYARRP
jgi:FkbM family methyltransferase